MRMKYIALGVRGDDSGFSYQRPLEATPPSREQFLHFQAHLGRLMQESGFLTQPHARTEEQLQALLPAPNLVVKSFRYCAVC
ncbi:hypothetical protein HSBAA_27850 [Vreelandella sulfidaeris]|uniref:Uncharacterized protein n=1 Tax=Vreelandella sulfidaeris TaxID=115553 RepID=A0A455UA08_9GAMM|nr:hypothetical protein HSBAA_27850 [Halomonas sulfidaeris]